MQDLQLIHTAHDHTAQVELSISADGMVLEARVTPAEEHIFAREESLLAVITAVAKLDAVDRRMVRELVRQIKAGRSCEGCRVALGTAPVDGSDGKVVWFVRRFSPGDERAPSARSAQSASPSPDLHARSLFENVIKGRQLARVYPPTAGTDGTTVRGDRIPATPGRPAAIAHDKSISITQPADGSPFTLLVAAVDGYVHEENGALSVRNQLVIPENLDYGMGHIDFIGSVKVVGDVNKGFHLKARGTIEVGGSIVGDNIIQSDSDVVVRGFHHGGERGMVRAKGSYSVAVAHGVTTDTQGPIRIEREARDSTLATSDTLFAQQATIAGGRVLCVRGAEIGTVGTEVGTTTILELRNEREVTAEFRAVIENIQKHLAAKAALELHIGPFLRDRQRLTTLRDPLRNKIVNLINKYDEVNLSLVQLEATRYEMQKEERTDDARINVVKSAHAGTELCCGTTRLQLHQEVLGPASFRVNPESSAWEKAEFKPLQEES